MSTCPHDTGQPTGCPQCRPTAATLICPRCQLPVDHDVLFCGACGTATTSPFATAERVTIAHPLPPVDLAATRAVFARGGPASRSGAPVRPGTPPGSPSEDDTPTWRRVPVLVAIVAAVALVVAGIVVALVRQDADNAGAVIAPTASPSAERRPGTPGSGDPTPVTAADDGPSVQAVRRTLQPIAVVTRSLTPMLTESPRDDRVLAALGRQSLRLQQATDEVGPRLLRLDLPDGRRTALLAAVRDVHRLGVLLGRIGTAPSNQGLVAATRAEQARADAARSLDRLAAWLPGDPLGLSQSFEAFRAGLAQLWSTSG